MTILSTTLPLFSNDAGADFSDDRRYRYRLWRFWNTQRKAACFCMLNPSTADETELDPTLRRCQGFARSWGYGGMVVVNLFAIVSAYPKVLLTESDPVGPDNDKFILPEAQAAGVFVVGWGAFPKARERARKVVEMLRAAGVTPKCWGLTSGGHPRHPLYLRRDTVLEDYDLHLRAPDVYRI